MRTAGSPASGANRASRSTSSCHRENLGVVEQPQLPDGSNEVGDTARELSHSVPLSCSR